ncbi:cell division protein DedD [Pseudomonas trivialis]|nr:cell division protein DedD [Pseudomonas trivialis]PRB23425.1 cell division protein DedD [Pseudomonas sp. MYb60]
MNRCCTPRSKWTSPTHCVLPNQFQLPWRPAAKPGFSVSPMNDQQRLELEAAAFRRLVAHLDSRKDVQNIDLMNLSGFCRNCLSKWYKAEADERHIELSLDDAREVVYGMPYTEWKAQYQKEASADQQAAFAKGKTHD